MQKLVFFIFIIVTILPISLCAAYSGGTGTQTGPYQIAPVADVNQALLILKSDNFSDTEATVASLEAIGAHACHVISPRTVIAFVPSAIEEHVRGLSNVAEFHRNTVTSLQTINDANIATGISAWNSMLTPQAKTMQTTEAPPLVGDAFEPPVHKRSNLPLSPLAAQSAAPDNDQTSEFMIGKVAVGVILPESIGGTENWSVDRQNTVFNQIVSGLNWWAVKGGTIAHLTFYYDKQFSVPTQYEPINQMGEGDQDTWVTDIFQNMGYTSGDRFDCAREYINDLRQNLHTDWAYTFIVADSLNDSDGKFADGVYSAWGYLGGPYVIMTYDNDTDGISRMYRVASHETGHIFLASDEYCQPGYFCCGFSYYGYLHIYNGNCEKENPSSVPCMMRDESDAVCQYTNDQIGWRDSDGDGIADPVDNIVDNILSHHTTPVTERILTFMGMAQDVPYDSPTRIPATINTITTVKFRVDGGQWTDASPADGTFDADTEIYMFTTASLGIGIHHIESQAYSSSGNTSDIASQDVNIRAMIIALAGPNGAITPSGTFTKDYGSRQKFTAAPNMGYKVDKWYLDANEVQTDGSTYILGNIQTDHTVSVTFKLPDLTGQLGTILLPNPAVPGDKGNASVIITNVSNVTASGRLSIALYASIDQTFDDNDVFVGGAVNWSLNLAAGASKTCIINLSIPGNLSQDSYYLFVKIDSTNTIAESDEQNNTTVSSGTINVVWQAGDVNDTRSAVKMVVNDSNGVPVTFRLTGGGSLEIIGGDSFDQIVLHNTTIKSQLRITTVGRGKKTSLGDIIVGSVSDANGLKSILAGTTDLHGSINIYGSVGRIELRNIDSGHKITIGPSSNLKAGVFMKFGDVNDLTIDSNTPVKSISVIRWQGGSIDVPSIGAIAAKGNTKQGVSGDLNVDVTVPGVIGTVKAAGRLSGYWDCNSVKSITAADVNFVSRLPMASRPEAVVMQ